MFCGLVRGMGFVCVFGTRRCGWDGLVWYGLGGDGAVHCISIVGHLDTDHLWVTKNSSFSFREMIGIFCYIQYTALLRCDPSVLSIYGVAPGAFVRCTNEKTTTGKTTPTDKI